MVVATNGGGFRTKGRMHGRWNLTLHLPADRTRKEAGSGKVTFSGHFEYLPELLSLNKAQ